MRNSFGNLCRKMLAEVSDSVVSSIEDRVVAFLNKEPHYFDNIFKDKTRIVIPFLDNNLVELLKFLENNGLSNIDLKKGIGYKTVETQQGNKKQPILIGKFLNRLGKKDYLRWWEINKNKNKESDVSIVVSRSPIDLVRMSDHKEIKSCHAEGQAWFHCAVQEARTGGAIAYVVNTSDLNNVNLQDKEIFADKKRKVDGIEPLERLRLRRFEDKEQNLNFLVPEIRTYGIDHADLYDSVKYWALKSQKDELAKADWDNIDLRGGSYQDNDADEIWNKFIGSEFAGKKNSLDRDEEKSPEQVLERAEESLRNHSFKYYHVDVSLIDDNNTLLDYSASVSYQFDFDEFLQKPEEKDFEKLKDKMTDILELDRYSLDVNIDNENELVHIYGRLDPTGEYGEYDERNLQGFERFLDHIDNKEKEYKSEETDLFLLLINEGLLKNKFNIDELKNLNMTKHSTRDLYGNTIKDSIISFSNKFEIGNLKGKYIHNYLVDSGEEPRLADMSVHKYLDEAISKKMRITLTDHLLKKYKDENVVNYIQKNMKFDVIITAPDATAILYKDDPNTKINPKLTYDKDVKVYAKTIFNLPKTLAISNQFQSIIKDIDNYYPTIQSTILADWKEIQKLNKHNILDIIDSYQMEVKRKLQPGKVYLKNVNGDHQYYYRDKSGGIDMPVADFIKMNQEDTRNLTNYIRSIEDENYIFRAYDKQHGSKSGGGTIYIVYQNQKPHYFYKAHEYQKEMIPLEQVIEQGRAIHNQNKAELNKKLGRG